MPSGKFKARTCLRHTLALCSSFVMILSLPKCWCSSKMWHAFKSASSCLNLGVYLPTAGGNVLLACPNCHCSLVVVLKQPETVRLNSASFKKSIGLSTPPFVSLSPLAPGPKCLRLYFNLCSFIRVSSAIFCISAAIFLGLFPVPIII